VSNGLILRTAERGCQGGIQSLGVMSARIEVRHSRGLAGSPQPGIAEPSAHAYAGAEGGFLVRGVTWVTLAGLNLSMVQTCPQLEQR
jgi:hypothetical protein